MAKKSGDTPVVIDLGAEAPGPGPAEAPPIEGAPGAAQGAAMTRAVTLAGRRGSAPLRWALRLGGALVLFALGLWAYDWVMALLSRSPVLGWTAVALATGFVALCLLGALRELAAFGRLRRLDRLHRRVEAAWADGGPEAARAVEAELTRFYRRREELDWARANIAERAGDVRDGPDVLTLLEAELMDPLDGAATARIEAAARQVAAATALLPLTFADVAVALVANLRMIRQIAEIYGGRSGALGNWRLTRNVMAHLIATGLVAVGDDMLGSVAGGGMLSKLSRRFGEGVINGALTARVGVAAMEVCRPMPFRALARPSASAIVGRALTGLFTSGRARDAG